MENYIVSARKYRPTAFGGVVGQQALTTTLSNAITTGKLAHAYLFCGPRGVGKTTCARIFAKSINCLSPKDGREACGVCESCRAFDEGRSYNIHELDAASNNGVNEIRDLIDQVLVPPQIGKYKVFIIDEVHMLTTAAFNAFLKTLEEPPAHVVFILATTERHKILPTIISRCQVYDFNRMEVSDIVGHLKNVAAAEGIAYEEEALGVIAQKADGGMRDALSIFDQIVSLTEGNITYDQVIKSLGVLDFESFYKAVDLIIDQKIPDLMLELNGILQRGFSAQHFISGLASHFRELLVASDERTLSLIEASENVRQRYGLQAKRCKPAFLYRALRICNDCDMNYRASRNKRLLVEIALIELAQAMEEGSGVRPKTALRPIFKAASQKVAAAQPKAPQTSAPKLQTTTIVTPPQTVSQTSTTPSTPTFRGKPQTFSLRGGLTNGQTTAIKETTPTVSTAPIVTEVRPFSNHELCHEWRYFLNKLPREYAATAGRLKNIEPKLVKEWTGHIVFESQPVADCFLAIKSQMLDFMRTRLRNAQVNLTFEVEALSAPTKAKTPREHWADLLQKNRLIQKLQKELGLEYY
jgi:DNA polymerase-3 subunit gamma/tau